MRVAILEDDTHVGQLLSLWLEGEGHPCDLFATGESFQRALARESYDLLVLDWMLPDTSGDKVLIWVREHVDTRVPVVFVTARDSEEDIVRGLTLGADDYLVKPVRQREFLARVGAVTRRVYGLTDAKGTLNLPPYEVNLDTRQILLNGKPVDLTQKEFDLTAFLFRNAGRLLSRNHILDAVWGQQANLATRTVDTHMSRIRGKLRLGEETGWRLGAVYNHGYRLEHAGSETAFAG